MTPKYFRIFKIFGFHLGIGSAGWWLYRKRFIASYYRKAPTGLPFLKIHLGRLVIEYY
jgi:hypothetical protein